MSFGLRPKAVTATHDYLKWDGTLLDTRIQTAEKRRIKVLRMSTKVLTPDNERHSALLMVTTKSNQRKSPHVIIDATKCAPIGLYLVIRGSAGRAAAHASFFHPKNHVSAGHPHARWEIIQSEIESQ